MSAKQRYYYDLTAEKFHEGQEVVAVKDISDVNIKVGDHLLITRKMPYSGYVYCEKENGEEVLVYSDCIKQEGKEGRIREEDMSDYKLETALKIFAVIVFLVALALAIYNGIAYGNVITTTISGTEAEIETHFDFGLFIINFLKWIGIGLFGGGSLLAFANLVSRR